MRGALVALAAILTSVGAAHAQSPVPDTLRSSALTRAQETELNRRLGLLQSRLIVLASETELRERAVRNIAVEIFDAQPDLDFAEYAALVEGGAHELQTYLAGARERNAFDPALADLRERAVAAAEDGRLTEARALYDELIVRSLESIEARWAREDQEREAVRNSAREALARDIAEGGRLAGIAGDYLDAARRYADAVDAAPTETQRNEYRRRAASVLYAGSATSAALERAVQRLLNQAQQYLRLAAEGQEAYIPMARSSAQQALTVLENARAATPYDYDAHRAEQVDQARSIVDHIDRLRSNP